jgi:predicted AlkP superfamily phosphohydrolase/phosphomutase
MKKELKRGSDCLVISKLKNLLQKKKLNYGKVILIGLDSAPPELLFEEFIDDLPNIKKMMDVGLYGNLQTIEPPITVPAWACMVTSKNPGDLGLYGFRHRKGNSYTDYWIANSSSIRKKTIWDIIGQEGRKSALVGVPPSYPPKEINGNLVSCFITPTNKNYTFPPGLKDEIEELVGEYDFDVVFRTEDRGELLKGLYEMTEKRFEVIKYLIRNKKWEFFMSVEIGLDRLHHAFWKFYDKEHHLYKPGSNYENTIKEYYVYLDKKIGEVLGILDKETTVIIASDHGTKSMKGVFCINEWLIKEGYLVLKERPKRPIELGKARVDWNKTKAWAWGGYYSRIFVNLKGRETNGVVEEKYYNGFKEELKMKLSTISGPNGEVVKNKIIEPHELYGEITCDAPDLMASFDDYSIRAAGTLGHDTLFLSENDTGPDDSMHSMDGVLMIYDPKVSRGMEIKGASILDIAPTVLHLLGSKGRIEVPRGKIIQELMQ